MFFIPGSGIRLTGSRKQLFDFSTSRQCDVESLQGLVCMGLLAFRQKCRVIIFRPARKGVKGLRPAKKTIFVAPKEVCCLKKQRVPALLNILSPAIPGGDNLRCTFSRGSCQRIVYRPTLLPALVFRNEPSR